MLRMAGLDLARAAPIAGGGVDKWTVVVILPPSHDIFKSHFAKSVVSNVNDKGKRSSYVVMADALFRAITQDDFALLFKDSLIEYKPAHSFKYNGGNLTLHELKRGKKDRVYVFAYTGRCGRYIFLLESLHKNQDPTPIEIREYGEATIKKIVAAQFMSLEN